MASPQRFRHSSSINLNFGGFPMIFNNVNFDTYFKNYPDRNGYFGKYGGCYTSPPN